PASRSVLMDMDLEKQRDVRAPEGEGCLVAAVRLPVRIVALVVVLPVRMLWDALVAAGRVVNDTVLRPVGRALLWLGRAVFVWPVLAARLALVVAVGGALASLVGVVLVVPAVGVRGFGRAPVGRGVVWVLRAVGAVGAALGVGVCRGRAWLVNVLV